MELMQRLFQIPKCYSKRSSNCRANGVGVKLSNNEMSEFYKKCNLFLRVPTLFWFFNWSKDIDYLLNTTGLIGKFYKLLFSHIK